MDTLRDPRGRAGGRRDVDYLVCFAVKEEVEFFSPPAADAGPCRISVLVTGIGRRNAAHSIREALQEEAPRAVLTCGFAGGLNPKLSVGSVIFEEEAAVGLREELLELGAQEGRFYCSKRVAITASEKHTLWLSSGADAVEMESSVIRTICREFRVPSATIRVISDTAHDDLPLDFNALMTADDRINYLKLVWQVVRSPRQLPRLIEFQKHTVEAARRLGQVLGELLLERRIS